ncbi:hypothetical protein [Streptomyces sp. NPDC049590]|uniref:hypothetical protein n=1 Tax=Streptomyces sp. NPDC049590 TaxID=3154834 RepID=UPI0034407CE6
MTAYTPLGGIPYPEPADPANVPQHLQSLAEAVDARTILRYSTAAARDAAITTPAPGMVAWLAGPGQLTHYNGTAWLPVAAVPVFAQNNDAGSTASTTPVELLASASTDPLAAVFTVPPTGRVIVTVGAWINSSVAAHAFMGATVRRVSDGWVSAASTAERACAVYGTARVAASSQSMLVGLTPGVAYSATATYWTAGSSSSSNTATYSNRFIRVDPLL